MPSVTATPFSISTPYCAAVHAHRPSTIGRTASRAARP